MLALDLVEVRGEQIEMRMNLGTIKLSCTFEHAAKYQLWESYWRDAVVGVQQVLHLL